MKSKAGTYILLIAAVAVWGVIAWKIIDRKEPEFIPPAAQKPAAVREKNPQDTLWLDYRDPFLGNIKRSGSETVPEEIAFEIPVPPPAFNVAYHGRIKRNGVDNYMVNIEGEQFILRRGESENGYRLTETFGNDSVRFTKGGHSFTIPLGL